MRSGKEKSGKGKKMMSGKGTNRGWGWRRGLFCGLTGLAVLLHFDYL